jgi:hypothetical protein
MDAHLAEALIPIIAILATFGFPVGLVFVWKWFKLKEKELQVDVDFRRSSGEAIEQRVQRLESIILALDSDLRAKLNASEPPRHLMEAPATSEGGQAGQVREPQKLR